MNAICCSENLDFFIVFPRQCQPKHYGKILTSDGPVSGDQVTMSRRDLSRQRGRGELLQPAAAQTDKAQDL